MQWAPPGAGLALGQLDLLARAKGSQARKVYTGGGAGGP
jgi:hypothetical protein